MDEWMDGCRIKLPYLDSKAIMQVIYVYHVIPFETTNDAMDVLYLHISTLV